jgi:hypothetical protein
MCKFQWLSYWNLQFHKTLFIKIDRMAEDMKGLLTNYSHLEIDPNFTRLPVSRYNRIQ